MLHTTPTCGVYVGVVCSGVVCDLRISNLAVIWKQNIVRSAARISKHSYIEVPLSTSFNFTSSVEGGLRLKASIILTNVTNIRTYVTDSNNRSVKGLNTLQEKETSYVSLEQQKVPSCSFCVSVLIFMPACFSVFLMVYSLFKLYSFLRCSQKVPSIWGQFWGTFQSSTLILWIIYFVLY